MSIKKILKTPNKILRQKSERVSKDENVSSIIKDLKDTLAKFGYKGLGGLSSIQIGIPKRIFLIKIPKASYIVVNPEVVSLFGGKSKSWELCLSIPGIVGKVKRYRKAEIKYQDENLKTVTATFTSNLCRIFLHEMDHLDGKLFTDLIENKKTEIMSQKDYFKMRSKTDE